ncbi:MAG: CpsD/CapB family tyrosine-protein kinase [Myxococcota bacterium]
MGKVYDALKRAEEQRTRRVQSTASAASLSQPAEAEAPAPPPSPPRSRARGLLSGLSKSVRRSAAPEPASALNKRRITLLQPESFVAEQFRTLRARIDSLAATRAVGTLAVTSALPGDGKSLAAIGLAVVYSMQPGRRVLLMDCDLRQPAIAASLGLRVDAGLAEVLAGSATLEDAVLRVEGSELDVLPVRAIPQNPSELLGSEAMPRLLESLGTEYDRIILDLPPTLGLPDSKTVSELCDGVVFVVRADVTPEPEIASALEVIDRRRVLGIVMNGAEPTSSRYEAIR